MQRLVAQSTRTGADLFVLSAAFWLAFALRFEGDVPMPMLKRAVLLWPYVVGGQFVLLNLFGVTRFAWRYIGLWETKRIFVALLTSTAVLLTVRWGLPVVAGPPLDPRLQYLQVPVGVILIDFVLACLGVAGVRFLRRSFVEEYAARSGPARESVTTLLVGAGQAGALVAREIATRPRLGIQPVGFLDDDPLKLGTIVHGLRVLGSTDELTRIAQKVRVEQVLITIAHSTGPAIRRIVERCRRANLPVKIVPGIFEIVGGRVNLGAMRDVAIEDLLGREPVVLEEDSIEHVVRGRRVLITGAGGSIGQELCRQVARFGPKRLIAVDQAETSLFYAVRQVREISEDLEVASFIGDICDGARMRRIFAEEAPDAVFHAAAYKHVGMMEANVREAIRNNVLGTRLLADLAAQSGVSQFVMISTDKAVNPSSVMGASKRLAEIYVQALSQQGKTLFVAVRFGNVLGSAGSVVPIFREQIARGGPVTVTHPEMRRYFMTIEEASQLVLQAAGIGRGGEIFILDMGEPVKIVDLARDLITLSGLRVDDDIAIRFTGVRPGEKLFEELSVAAENADKTRHPKIFVGRIPARPLEEVRRDLDWLASLTESSSSDDELRAALRRLVPEYQNEETGAASPTLEEAATA